LNTVLLAPSFFSLACVHLVSYYAKPYIFLL
jgi:hypothetical protein